MFGFTSKTTREIGAEAEKLARDFLVQQGMDLVERNYQIKGGEIDLIMRDEPHLVFVEVRYRKNNRFGSGADSVDYRKQSRLIKAATNYLLEKSSHAHQPARFDVISITSSDTNPEIEWIKDAFQA
ncbi:MAG: YraN family protein [Gammaproteobacteria bacterium]|jgi:putative endonuclease